MTDATRSQLEQAYRLIQQDDLNRAVAILKPIVAAQPDNADAWWLMAHAVSDPQDAREPLENVLRLNPAHIEARDLLTELDQDFPAFESFGSSGSSESPTPFPSDVSLNNLFGDTPTTSTSSGMSSSELDDLLGQRPMPSGGESFFQNDNSSDFGSFDMSDDAVESPTSGMFQDPFPNGEPGFVADVLDEEQKKADTRKEKREAAKAAKEKEKAEREKARQKAKVVADEVVLDPFELERRANSRPPRVLIFALALLVVIVIGGGLAYVLLPRLLAPSTGVPPIPVTPDGTIQASAVAAVATADVNSTIQATNDLFTANKFVNAKTAIVPLTLGDTLQVQVCAVAGPKLSEDINKAMDIVAQEASKAKNSLKAAGVDFLNCAKPGVKLTTVTAPIDAIVAYVNGGMTDKRTYRASWKKN